MAEINFGTTVSLAEAATLIAGTPMNRYLLEGEPGIGKSSIIKLLAAMFPTHNTAYVDVPNLDLGDIAMPVIDRETKTTVYYPNARFKIHLGKPVITMLDEFTKGPDPVKNMLHPMLEVSNPRLGDISVHYESLTFLTGNMSGDGVGDSMKAHTRNRIIPLHVRKPDADEWMEWAMNNDIAPEVIAWVRQYPHALASYTDSANADNPYIFNPRKAMKGFVSPRSLEVVSNIIKTRAKYSTNALIAAMTGAVGESASRDMQAYIEFSDQLPTWESVTTNPRTASVPTSAGACAIIVFGAINKVTKDTFSPFMEYLERFEAEWQACFAINIAKTPAKQSIAFGNKKFAEWVQKNEDLL